MTSKTQFTQVQAYAGEWCDICGRIFEGMEGEFEGDWWTYEDERFTYQVCDRCKDRIEEEELEEEEVEE